MKRIGMQWDRARIDGRTYVHVGVYVDSPDKRRTTAKIAAIIAVLAFAAMTYVIAPDVDIHTTQQTQLTP